MSNLINRQHVIDCLMGVIGHLRNEVPSAEPERHRGEWIVHEKGFSECSKCGYIAVSVLSERNYNFCPNCGADMRAKGKTYRQLAQNLREVGNPPLTWEELRTMVGKPVWIDSVPLVRRWVIIKKFHPIGGNKNLFDMEVEDGAHFLRKNMRRDDPAWWQAYRKEREND